MKGVTLWDVDVESPNCRLFIRSNCCSTIKIAIVCLIAMISTIGLYNVTIVNRQSVVFSGVTGNL